jgi:CubicO group peptidase (beta-lactamase class C family)
MRRSALLLVCWITMTGTALTLAPSVAGSQAPAPAQPQAANPAASLPDSPLGRLGLALVSAVNSGDSATINRFVSDHVGVDERSRSSSTMARMLVTLHEQSGGLDIERARMADAALRIMTHARNGRRWLGIQLDPAVNDTTRIGNMMLLPMDDPGPRYPPKPWATTALSDEQVATLIRDHVRQAADSDHFSGVVLVAHGDRILAHEVYGFADQGAQRRNTRATRFATASVGKMFTSVAIAQLVERGLLRFDDTVAKILPEYPNREAANRITVRQLLTHTAGVPEPFWSSRFGAASPRATQLELLATFADAPLEMEPGSAFRYSNGNYATLGAIIEKLSGERYEDYLRRHVWGPAGMTRVEHPAWTLTADEALGYARFAELDPLGVDPRKPDTVRNGAPVQAELRGFGGGAFTAEDLFRFARALRTGKLVRREMADTLTTGRVDIGEDAPVTYGFGFSVQQMDDQRVVGHPGSNPDTGHDADVEMVGDGEWTVVVLSNYDAPAGMQMEWPILSLLAQQSSLAAKGKRTGAAEPR